MWFRNTDPGSVIRTAGIAEKCTDFSMRPDGYLDIACTLCQPEMHALERIQLVIPPAFRHPARDRTEIK